MYHSKKSLICLEIYVIIEITDLKRKTHMHNINIINIIKYF